MEVKYLLDETKPTQREWTLFGKLDSLNTWIGAMNHNRYVGASIKKRNERLIMKSLETQDCSSVEPHGSWEYHWHLSNKRTDPSNIAVACKFIEDAFQTAGILPNDNWLYVNSIHHEYSSDVPAGMEYVEVKVTWE